MNPLEVKIKARAKINLTLDVVGKRPNGYHDVEMIMQQVDLYDVVTVSKREDARVVLSCSDPFLPVDERNIAYRAAKDMMATYGLPRGFNIHIEKHIPVCAGLAGGSTDAAATIKGINLLMGLGASEEDLAAIGLKLGADVPFCLMTGAALAKGIGESLEPIRGLENTWLLLVKPNFGVSTKEVYEALVYQDLLEKPDTKAMLKALETQNKSLVMSLLCNVLESVTLPMYPEVKRVKQMLKAHGAGGVLMSGSGPTVFGLYKNHEKALRAYKKIKMHYPQTYVVSTYKKNASV